MNCSTPGFPVLHYLPEFAQTHLHGVGDAIQPSHPLSPLLLLPSIFSSELSLHIREPKYWSFNFSISPSNEYSGSDFKTDWFQLLAFQGTLKSLLQYPSSKHQFFGAQPSLWSNSHVCIGLLEKREL